MLAGLVLVAGCAPAATGPASPAAARRILSLNPCTDAILAEVAEPGQVVALSAYSRDPAQASMDPALARRFAATGGTVEEVVAARPDLVLSGSLTPPATRAALARLGIALAEFSSPRDVGESEAQIRAIAGLTGHPERGAALVRRIEAALAVAAAPRGARPISALVWQSGGMVPGADTLIASLLGRTGFASFSAVRGLRQADILPLEEVLAHPPRVILVAGRDTGTGDDRMLGHPALRALAGTRRFALDPTLEYCGGPTILRAAARLAQVRREIGA